MEFQNFSLSVNEKGIAFFTANRPEKLNAMNDRSWFELRQFFEEADKDPSIRAVIVTGAGEKAFVAGADIGSLKEKRSTDCLGGAGQKALDQIENCSKPVIAAVNGYAFGGGCELALACDLRIVSENAQFALPETGLGILPGAGGTQRLARIIGLGRAKEMILLGRKIRGAEAVQIGLAYKCVPIGELLTEAEKMADAVLAKGPVAINLSKKVVKASLSSSQDVGMLLEMLALSTLCSTEDKQEGVEAFLEKHAPVYKGR